MRREKLEHIVTTEMIERKCSSSRGMQHEKMCGLKIEQVTDALKGIWATITKIGETRVFM